MARNASAGFFVATIVVVIAQSACNSTPARVAPPPPPPSAASTQLMSPMALQELPANPADERIAYGTDSSEFADLRVPSGTGPHPVVVLIHGGCFKATYATLRDLAPMGDALKADGMATWNIEYRRVGHPGGGWPGTYLDVSRAIDYLPKIASKYSLDLDHVVVVGHSAGGHLAMWAAARSRVPAASEIHTSNPLRIRGVVDLAGPLDLSAHIQEYQTLCRDSVITSLMGGTPASVPQRYAQASPIKLLPLGVPQVIVIGSEEEFVPKPLVDAYVNAAAQAGDSVRMILIPRVGHFEIASPTASPWPKVEAAIRTLMNGKLPPA